MSRASGERGKPCVVALRHLFRRVANSADPGLFDSVPKVDAATVKGDRAIVVLHRGYQRRSVSLTRVGDRWQITGLTGFR